MSEFVLEAAMEAIECCECSMTFGVPRAFRRARRRDHETFYCPAGHPMYNPDKSDLEKLEERVAEGRHEISRAHNRADRAQDCCERKERSRRAYKAHLTRARNKLAELTGQSTENHKPNNQGGHHE